MYQAISSIAAFQALFFSVLILTKKNKSMLDKHLSSWLLLLTLNILCISVSQNENLLWSGFLVYPVYILAGLHGFFLYLCTKSLINNSAKDFKKRTYNPYWIPDFCSYWIHSLPFISSRNSHHHQDNSLSMERITCYSCRQVVPSL